MFYLIFLFFCFFLSGEEFDVESIISIENEPSLFVANKVNVITGKWHPSQTDLVVQGVEPIVIQRSFASNFLEWVIFPGLSIEQVSSHKNGHEYLVTESSGAQIRYKYTNQKIQIGTKKYRGYAPSNLNKGYTNTSRGKISSRSNLRNQILWVGPEEKKLILQCSDGTIRKFIKKSTQSSKYILISEHLPNGNWIFYDYVKKHKMRKLSLIRTLSPDLKTEYARATICYESHRDRITSCKIIGSDGQSVEYRYKDSLNSVCSSNHPDETFQYFAFDPRLHFPRQVRSISMPLNRFVQADYYTLNSAVVCGHKVQMNHVFYEKCLNKLDTEPIQGVHPDPRCGRVMTLSAPIGTNPNPQVTHSFLYSLEKKMTSVFDIENLRSDYYWDENFRLIEIHRFDAESKLRIIHRFSWHSNGDLLEKSLLDSNRNQLSAIKYRYNNRGDILEERVYGNLSGQEEGSYGRRFTYFSGKISLLKSIEEDNGKKVEYTYLDDSDLITSQFTLENAEVKERKFWHYNANRILVSEITEAGTHRFVKKITPKPEAPYIGLPWIIEEKCGPDEKLIRKTVLHYTKGAKISQKDIYDSEGTYRYSLTYKYDDKGRLIEQTDPLGRMERIGYNACGNKIFHESLSGRTATHFEFDFANQIISAEKRGDDGIILRERYEYDLKNRMTYEEKPFGHVAKYTYDSFGFLAQKIFPNTDHAVCFLHDSKGCLLSEKNPDGGNKEIRYNAYDQPIWIQSPDGGVKKFVYYSNGWLKTAIEADGVETSYTYDWQGRPLSKIVSQSQKVLAEEHFRYDGFSMIDKLDAEGNRTAFTHDPAGKLSSVELAGEKIEYFYDSLGRLCLEIQGDLHLIKEYDLADRVIGERHQDPEGRLLKRIQYGYNTSNQRTSTVQFLDGRESKESSLFDSMDRLIQKTDPLENHTYIVYEETPLLKETITDPMGLRTVKNYNAQGKVARLEVTNKHGVLLDLQEYTYDFRANLINHRSEIFAPARVTSVAYQYDLMGRVRELTEVPESPNPKRTQYRYDLKGQLIQTLKPNGAELNYSYHPLGSLSSLSSADGSIQYVYSSDRLGRQLLSLDVKSGQKTEREYDPHGRVIRETLGTGLTLCSRYDNTGRRAELIFPDASSVTYQYNPLSLSQITRNDERGNPLYSHAFVAYDASGRLTEEKLIGDLGVLTHTYDLCGRKHSQTSLYFSEQVLQRDATGNILDYVLNGTETHYVYDDLYQLASEDGLFPHEYVSDAHYCLGQKDGESYPINELLQIKTIPHDLNGNPKAFNGMEFIYDALDRLIAIETSDQRITYTYDSDHRRLSKTINTRTQTHQCRFLYDGQNEIGSVDASGKIVELRILRAPHTEIGSAVALEIQDKVYAPIHDLNGHVRLLISLESKRQEVFYQYSAYAEEKNDSPIANPWRFSSKRTDPETGFVYYGRRYYSPQLARWLTPDPAGFTETLNLYVFTKNNPLRYLDFFGLYASDRASDLHYSDRNHSGSRDIGNSTLPEVAFNDFHENFWTAVNGIQKGSAVSDLGLPEKSNHHRILFINGIWNDFDSCKESAEYISKLAGGYNVHFVYNASFGKGVDLLECSMGLKYLATEPVLQLKSKFDEFFDTCPEGANFLLIAHSQGAIHARNFLLTCPKEQSKHIQVAAFAPAAYIYEETTSGLTHYRSASWWRDFVPRLDKEGARRAAGTIIDLPWSSANPFPLSVHSFQHKIYQNSLKQEIINYYK